MHILGWVAASFASLMTKDLLHKVHTSLCWCSLPHSSAHSKHSSRLQHYLVHQLWWLLHTLIIEQWWCFLGALLLKAPHEEHVDWEIPDNFDTSHVQRPCYNRAIAFNLFSFGNILMGKENLHNSKRKCQRDYTMSERKNPRRRSELFLVIEGKWYKQF